MAITLAGTPTSTGNSTDSTSRTVDIPSGVVDKTVVVCMLDRWFGSNINPAVTFSGFTPITPVADSGDSAAKLQAFWKRATGPESGTYSCSWSGNAFAILTCIPLNGVLESGDPTISPQVWGGTAGTFGSLSLTAEELAALIWRVYNDSGGTHTPPTGYTEVVDVDCGAMAWATAPSTGSHTASGGSVTSSSPAAAMLFGVRPQLASANQGVLAGTTVAPVGTLAAIGEATAVVAGSPPVPTSNLTATAEGLGMVAGAPPAPTGTLTAVAVVAGALAGTLPAPEGTLETVGTSSGALAASLPLPVSSLQGGVPSGGFLAGLPPAPVGALTAVARAGAVLAGQTAVPVGSMAGTAVSSGVLAGIAPAPVGSLADGSVSVGGPPLVTAAGQVTPFLVVAAGPVPPFRVSGPA